MDDIVDNGSITDYIFMVIVILFFILYDLNFVEFFFFSLKIIILINWGVFM